MNSFFEHRQYHRSRYTIITDIVGSCFALYNTKTGNRVIVDLRYHPELGILREQRQVDCDMIGEEALHALVMGGFFVEPATDELGELRSKRLEALSDDYGLRLAVLPTLACNFACPYCFQESVDGPTMTAETEESLIQFARRNLVGRSRGPLVVMWFGGEPLLELAQVRRLSVRFRMLAQEVGVPLEFSMVTNGYCLDLLTAELLDELQLKSIQVTLDGPRGVHDERRPLRIGGPTYDVILDNIVLISQFYHSIIVRINVDRSNYRAVPSLFIELGNRGILDRCWYDLGCVDAATGACRANSCQVLQSDDWAHVESYLYTEMARLGVLHRAINRYPRPWSLTCSAQLPNAYVVDPSGNVFKCLNDVSLEDRAVYNINANSVLNTSREVDLRIVSPFGSRRCESCQYLPVCNRGCPSANIDSRSNISHCTPLRYSLVDRLTSDIELYLCVATQNK